MVGSWLRIYGLLAVAILLTCAITAAVLSWFTHEPLLPYLLASGVGGLLFLGVLAAILR